MFIIFIAADVATKDVLLKEVGLNTSFVGFVGEIKLQKIKQAFYEKY